MDKSYHVVIRKEKDYNVIQDTALFTIPDLDKIYQQMETVPPKKSISRSRENVENVLLGNAHTYYETVEFTTANVGNGAKAALSAKFTVLAGTYTVSEEKTARYAFGSIHDVVNGTVSGQTAVLNVSGKKDGTETAGPSGLVVV